MPKLPQRENTWKQHVASYAACEACELCNVRSNIVLARGQLPCDILLIGEAPGVSEDILGRPFCGPAGQELDRWIARAGWAGRVQWAFTNLIGCIPKDHETNSKTKEPPTWAIEACRPRLADLVRVARPRAIVCVGKLSVKHVDKTINVDDYIVHSVVHPAYVLRMNAMQQPMTVQSAIITLVDVLQEVLNE